MDTEHVSTVLARTFDGTPANNTTVLRDAPRPAAPVDARRTLPDLVRLFEAEEARENPDLVTSTNVLRMNPEGLVEVPRLGVFAFTDWSRRQCASMLGVRWDRWFENASGPELADEMNRRFARANGSVRVRTTRAAVPDAVPGVDGTLRAFVSPGYTPIADARLARMLLAALAPGEHEFGLIRADITDRTASYVVALGKPFHRGGSGRVGQLWGGLLVRNSGVGYASLVMVLHLTRLLCLNGMTAPMPDAMLLRRRHRGIADTALRVLLAEKLVGIPERLASSADRLVMAEARSVVDPKAEVSRLLADAGLPARHLAPIMDAYRREPIPNAFGISQAVTLAAQGYSPEGRLELEEAAGQYLAHGA